MAYESKGSEMSGMSLSLIIGAGALADPILECREDRLQVLKGVRNRLSRVEYMTPEDRAHVTEQMSVLVSCAETSYRFGTQDKSATQGGQLAHENVQERLRKYR